ncbi:Nucleoside phosphorylase [Streptomyces sp. SceaMP-e96]|uniref:phosphorylase family protein n=1 Tax=unclassified Streptomyces TaxID=2593676 RepID=UPI000823A17C|nr:MULTISPECIES: 1-hydroxy-2-methyl-2-butenyl 4-diphosphate reductase [unclassified Streptomyces]MYT12983.1 1-hydroxy-2-methyl-2-butenyl 4-diphosphate reductase [Streptomyces sp. SID4951]SCK44174.1 Nucleoside phosphorylase [Streptomyces sp. SceaMP-e96]
MPGRPPTDAEPPLLIACALGIERFALRGRGRGGASAGGTVPRVVTLRTGMGPHAAERALTEALSEGSVTERSPVVASGFCAGLAPGMRRGDVVVAEATRGHQTAAPETPCRDNGPLLRALRERGLTVHSGLLCGSDHVVRGAERAELHAAGAVAVDMESAATLRAAQRAGGRPVAAVRVVVDAPEHELVRIGTVRGGISAFRVLRSVVPVFHEWHRSLLLPWR